MTRIIIVHQSYFEKKIVGALRIQGYKLREISIRTFYFIFIGNVSIDGKSSKKYVSFADFMIHS